MHSVNMLEVGDLKTAQKVDTVANRIRSSKKKNSYIEKDGVLHYKEGDLERIYVPQSYTLTVMTKYHAGFGSMHQGAEKTFKCISKKYYWPGMRKIIEEFCKSCPLCIQKKKTKESHGIPANLPSEGLWECVYMDCLGPYPTTNDGNRFILAAIDSFSRNVEVRAVESTTSQEVIRFLMEDIIARHGIPRTIITDNGTNFISAAIKEVYQNLGIENKQTTPYNPEGNGIIERFNRTLGTAMRVMGEGATDQSWDRLLPGILLAYRNTPHKTTGETPFFLEHGRDKF